MVFTFLKDRILMKSEKLFNFAFYFAGIDYMWMRKTLYNSNSSLIHPCDESK